MGPRRGVAAVDERLERREIARGLVHTASKSRLARGGAGGERRPHLAGTRAMRVTDHGRRGLLDEAKAKAARYVQSKEVFGPHREFLEWMLGAIR